MCTALSNFDSASQILNHISDTNECCLEVDLVLQGKLDWKEERKTRTERERKRSTRLKKKVKIISEEKRRTLLRKEAESYR